MAKRKSKSLQDAPKVMEDLPSMEEGLSSSKKYKVQLTYLPAMEVEAFTETEAVELYNKFLGVIKTNNKYTVTLV